MRLMDERLTMVEHLHHVTASWRNSHLVSTVNSCIFFLGQETLSGIMAVTVQPMIDQATKKIAVISSYLLPGCNLHDSTD